MALFLREVQCLRRLDAHPNIVRYFNSWVEVSPSPLTPENAMHRTSLPASRGQAPLGAKASWVRSPLTPWTSGRIPCPKVKKIFRDGGTSRWKIGEQREDGEESDGRRQSHARRISRSSSWCEPESEETGERNSDYDGGKKGEVKAFRGSLPVSPFCCSMAEDGTRKRNTNGIPRASSCTRPPCASVRRGRRKVGEQNTVQTDQRKHRHFAQSTLSAMGARVRPSNRCVGGASSPFDSGPCAGLSEGDNQCKTPHFFSDQHGGSSLCGSSPKGMVLRAKRRTTRESDEESESGQAGRRPVSAEWGTLRSEKRNRSWRREQVSETLNAALESARKEFLRLHEAASDRLGNHRMSSGNNCALSCNGQSCPLWQETTVSTADCVRWSAGNARDQEEHLREEIDKEKVKDEVTDKWNEDVGQKELDREDAVGNGQGTSIVSQGVGHAFARINKRLDGEKKLGRSPEAKEGREGAYGPRSQHAGENGSPPDGAMIPAAQKERERNVTLPGYEGTDTNDDDEVRSKKGVYHYRTGGPYEDLPSNVWSHDHPITSLDRTPVRLKTPSTGDKNIRNAGKKPGTKCLVSDDFWPCYGFYSDDGGEDGLQIVFAEVEPGGTLSSAGEERKTEEEKNAAGRVWISDAKARYSCFGDIGANTAEASTKHGTDVKGGIRSIDSNRGDSGRMEMGEWLMGHMAVEKTDPEKDRPLHRPFNWQPAGLSPVAVGGITAEQKEKGARGCRGRQQGIMGTADSTERSCKSRRRHSCCYPRCREEKTYLCRGRSQSSLSARWLPADDVEGWRGEAQKIKVRCLAEEVVGAAEFTYLKEEASDGIIHSVPGRQAGARDSPREAVPEDKNDASIRKPDSSHSPRTSYNNIKDRSPLPLIGGRGRLEISCDDKSPHKERQGDGRQEVTVFNLPHGRETVKRRAPSSERRGQGPVNANISSQNNPDRPVNRRPFLGRSHFCERNQCRVAVTLYIQMEYCGMSLDEYIAQTPEVDPERNEEIVAMIISGLYQCHSAGVMHRDLKPSNIFIDKETGVVKIGDFGLAFSGDMEASPRSSRDSGISSKDSSSKSHSAVVTLSSPTPTGKKAHAKKDEGCQVTLSGVRHSGGNGVKNMKEGAESVHMSSTTANTCRHQNLQEERQQSNHCACLHNCHVPSSSPSCSATSLTRGAQPHANIHEDTRFKTQAHQNSPCGTSCMPYPASAERTPQNDMLRGDGSTRRSTRPTLDSGVGENVTQSVGREAISDAPEISPNCCAAVPLPSTGKCFALPSPGLQKSRDDSSERTNETLTNGTPLVLGKMSTPVKICGSHAPCLTPRTTLDVRLCESPILSSIQLDLATSETEMVPWSRRGDQPPPLGKSEVDVNGGILTNKASVPHQAQSPVASPGGKALRPAPSLWCTVNERTTGVGTRAYAPPEQLQGGRYDFSVDIWALGLIVLNLFTRCNTAMEQAMNFRNARDGRFPPNVTSTYPWIVPFCRWCLQKDPSKRPTVRQLYQHYWSTGSVFGPKIKAPKCSTLELLSRTENQNVSFPQCCRLPHVWTGACLPHRLPPSEELLFYSPKQGCPSSVESHLSGDDEPQGSVPGIGQSLRQHFAVVQGPAGSGLRECWDQASSSFDAQADGQDHPSQSYPTGPLGTPCHHSSLPADWVPLSFACRSRMESAHTSTIDAGERSSGDTVQSPTVLLATECSFFSDHLN
ncbi:putative PIK3R4 kinase-related protein (incomplete catalytic triad) [Neospora caninum Liverpool]|uniref:Putative PIK3R4 kinase-related protein (Incomplete catalytic triad) n=1 Tax=Neospora caninum (strain Liverpool) TaxID=572307 RepID=F0VN19_NEOCL|nr:putative PIK3R4 kinase-related protein (incomplete catalytic triad) [Neospora caninum Liverpool]CBZ55115.1 putative PIK3R4 kinase-related protein (incomplete catalytic triad) [Neospora caninum Liverpool]|eukprot:XP_003885143.1 putative PIK3R4 kinase-related protein (incomplete catalytic triad) [Neospora caninum Liverpool]